VKNQEQNQDNRWYAKDLSTILGELNASHQGLSQAEAQKRLDKYGPNKLPEPKVDSIFKIFLKQFQSPLIYVLLIATLIVFFLKEYTDAGIIFFVLLFNAVIGVYQEGRSRNTLLALRRFVETKARVLRDGREILIPDFQVVPGDILVIEQGDKIAADASRVITSPEFRGKYIEGVGLEVLNLAPEAFAKLIASTREIYSARLKALNLKLE